jgi:predicted TIM-barrel fold metal-dependent hydrolase
MAGETKIEPIIDADLPIIDAHHHLCFLPESILAEMEKHEGSTTRSLIPTFRRNARYLFDEYMTDLGTGHNIRASVHVDAEAMYRATGPEAMKSVGEVEFINGVAAMSASGLFGEVRVCAGIVGGIDLRAGNSVEEVLRAHIQAGGGRYRGVRCGGIMAYDEDPSVLGVVGSGGVPHLLLDPQFRAGFGQLHKCGLSFDAWLLEPQLPELIDLARSFPDTQIILNHAGAPVGVGRYAGKREDRFPYWRESIRTLATCPNMTVKLGGLGQAVGGFSSFMSTPPATSVQLATEWEPYIETCIEAFGANRCMFESNFPVDSATCTYPVLWNAFKRLVAGASRHEKAALFSGTAARIYRLET